ncbi:MAG: hypothetical protein JEZ08_04150 [Clostridiales bacterium]|nr:hypothetical protein [Clostridiales bacterium]
MKKRGLIILLSLIIVILFFYNRDMRKSLNLQKEQQGFNRQRILQQDELNNLLKSDILTHQNQIAQLEEEKLALSDQIEILGSEIIADNHIFNSIMNYVLDDGNIPKIETFNRNLFVDSTQLDMDRNELYKVIKKDSILSLSPSPLSLAVRRVDDDYLVRVLEKQRIEHGDYKSDWYYIELMYMDSKTDIRGWILVKHIDDYTPVAQKTVVNIKTKKNAVVYNTTVFDNIEETPGIVYPLSKNARILSRKDGYVLLFGTDETYFWVHEDDLDYLDTYN